MRAKTFYECLNAGQEDTPLITPTVAKADIDSFMALLSNALRSEVSERIEKCSESVDAEVARRVDELVSKTEGATLVQALAFIGRERPELMERWMRESYA